MEGATSSASPARSRRASAPPPSYQASIGSPPLAQDRPQSQRSAVFEHPWGQLNLPSGMFILQNRAQGKALDLLGHRSHDGAPFGVHPVKQPSLHGLSLQHTTNNQLFFLDWDGHLYSAAASRAVDVVEDKPVLAHPRPIQTYPTPLSHPTPRFYLDPSTSTLQVLFSHDPTFPPPLHPTSAQHAQHEYDYLVETVPVRRRKPLLPSSSDPSVFIARKAGEVRGGIEGLLGRVGNLNPFAASSGPASPVEHKRLPRERDASLPAPPLPSKDSPPLPSPPIERESVASSAGTRISEVATAESEQSPHSERETDDDDDEEYSDDEPSAFRPVRIVRIPRASRWRETEFPFNPIDRVKQLIKEREAAPIGLGFELVNAASSENSNEDGDGVSVENVWPESLHPHARRREQSFASASTAVIDRDLPGISRQELEAKRKHKKLEMKEHRKWRRRQWDVIPVRVEPSPGSNEASSLNKHDLEEEIYESQGATSENQDGYELGEEDAGSVRARGRVEEDPETLDDVPALTVQSGKRGSIAGAVVSGVGTFLANRLPWSASTASNVSQGKPSKAGSEEGELPALPHQEDDGDAREVDSEELEELAVLQHAQSRRNSTKPDQTSPPLPAVPQFEDRGASSSSGVEPARVPLPDSAPATPQRPSSFSPTPNSPFAKRQTMSP
ncbi:uncharacterized protein JCM15063_005950 [Sporobolomyces koalae]|uniref:uncharacterized protein n=1 Tax=Sporobolomyces koalae TaxID=500713 RepID=UPI00316CA109